jgi:hypothetical protein
MMNYFMPLLILIILAVIYAGSLQKSSSRLMVVVIVLFLILSLCWIQLNGNNKERFMNFSGYSPLGYNMRISGADGSAPVGCGGYDYAGINNRVGNAGYDGLLLKSKLVTKPLLNDVTIFSPVGDGYKLGDAIGSDRFPNIDGTPNSPRSMFVLKNSQVSWDCCPSIHSSDMGCVCTSKEQMDMFAGRGKNRTAPDTYPSM